MKCIKGAIIGFGNIALNGHLPGFRTHDQKIEIVALFDPLEERRDLCASVLPEAHFYSDLADMFSNEPLDFVDIATPPAHHGSNVIKALDHNLHVLCEKPLVLDAQELEQIDSGIKATGNTVFTVHNWRYSPVFQETSTLIESGVIGNVDMVRYEVKRTMPSVAVGEDSGFNWRLDPNIAGGGILVDHGWHAFYMVNQWFKASPVTVECRFENRKYTAMPVEDTATALFRYQERGKAELFFTWAGDRRENSVFITGDKGVIKVLDNRIVCETDKGIKEIAFDEGLSQGSHHPDWYGKVIDGFIGQINDKDAKNANFFEASCCFRMLNACRKSAAYKTLQTV